LRFVNLPSQQAHRFSTQSGASRVRLHLSSRRRNLASLTAQGLKSLLPISRRRPTSRGSKRLSPLIRQCTCSCTARVSLAHTFEDETAALAQIYPHESNQNPSLVVPAPTHRCRLKSQFSAALLGCPAAITARGGHMDRDGFERAIRLGFSIARSQSSTSFRGVFAAVRTSIPTHYFERRKTRPDLKSLGLRCPREGHPTRGVSCTLG
jgi:hypothetical protein